MLLGFSGPRDLFLNAVLQLHVRVKGCIITLSCNKTI